MSFKETYTLELAAETILAKYRLLQTAYLDGQLDDEMSAAQNLRLAVEQYGRYIASSNPDDRGIHRPMLDNLVRCVEERDLLKVCRGPISSLEKWLQHYKRRKKEAAAEPSAASTSQPTWDVFVCHASEDKDDFVRPLAEALTDAGLKVWYDEFTLQVGDRLRREIDKGLRNSRFGIVVVSPNFFEKDWPQEELDALAIREVGGREIILPVWHKVGAEEVAERSSLMAARMAVKSSDGLQAVTSALLEVIRPDAANLVEVPTDRIDATAPTTSIGDLSAGLAEPTVFFDERLCEAFPGVRGLTEFPDSADSIPRLQELLKPPLVHVDPEGNLIGDTPIWWLGVIGSMPITSFQVIDKSRVLIDSHRIDISCLTAYRSRSYWASFVIIEWKPEEPAGLYDPLDPDTPQHYRAEEYAIWKDELITREQYDDGGLFRDGHFISTNDAKLQVRFLGKGLWVITSKYSPLHSRQFDRRREELLTSIIDGKEEVGALAEVVETLPRHDLD